jgi:hypothetical protein
MQYLTNKAHQLGNAIRYRLATAVVLLGAVLLVATAIGFSIAGGYIWLSMQLPSYLAAFIVAGVLCLLSAIMLILASRRSDGVKTPLGNDQPDPAADANLASEQIVRSALTVTMDTPIKAIVAATAMGIIVGLLRAKR